MRTMADKIKIEPCLWFNKNAEDAAEFYAATFPDSRVTAVRKAPGDYPNGKAGDVLTVEFTVLGHMMKMKKIDIATIEAARRG